VSLSPFLSQYFDTGGCPPIMGSAFRPLPPFLGTRSRWEPLGFLFVPIPHAQSPGGTICWSKSPKLPSPQTLLGSSNYTKLDIDVSQSPTLRHIAVFFSNGSPVLLSLRSMTPPNDP